MQPRGLDRMYRDAPAPDEDAAALVRAVAGGSHDAHLVGLRRLELQGRQRPEVLAAIEARLTELNSRPG